MGYYPWFIQRSRKRDQDNEPLPSISNMNTTHCLHAWLNQGSIYTSAMCTGLCVL